MDKYTVMDVHARSSTRALVDGADKTQSEWLTRSKLSEEVSRAIGEPVRA